MARLRSSPAETDDESELPELEDLLLGVTRIHARPKGSSDNITTKRSASNVRTLAANVEPAGGVLHSTEERLGGNNNGSVLVPKTELHSDTGSKMAKKKQRPLGRIENNSVLLRQIEDDRSKIMEKLSGSSIGAAIIKPRPTQRGYDDKILERVGSVELPDEFKHSTKNDTLNSDDAQIEDSLAEIEFWTKPRQIRASPVKPIPQTPRAQRAQERNKIRTDDPRNEAIPFIINNSSKIPGKASSISLSQSQQGRPYSSSEDDEDAFLIYNPTQKVSSHKPSPSLRPSTPPPLHLPKSRLTSPSKSTRIPPGPHRPSFGDFWSQEIVNEWNEQYSPRKVLTSPRKKRFQRITTPQSDEDSDSPCLSPTMPPRKSPSKSESRAKAAKKRSFDTKKHEIAESFFKELDATVTNGEISKLAEPTGGVKLIWNKKLNTTAGRANWRRESKIKSWPDGQIEKEYRHYANIELADKVIDDENRLVNVLAHEFCHLANFMISGIKDNPHGREFKEWAKKCSTAFRNRGVLVTTKHSYSIDYKYIWECTECGQEFKRHSKSIDPSRKTCGRCRSRLIQTKPPPRNTNPSEYQIFVKENFQRVKGENLGKSHAHVMELLGKLYRTKKSIDSRPESQDDMEMLTKALDIVKMND